MTLRNTALATTAMIGVSTIFMIVGSKASAAVDQCGQAYSVQAGDTLSKIARDVYGSARDFQIIYSANADVIGSNPALIEIGMALNIPCLDDTSTSIADVSAITQPVTSDALPVPSDRAIRVVTGSNWAPFNNEDQEQGGMIVEITNVALAAANGSPEYKIDFVNDWGAHLQPLISDHAYDFSISWFKPNCDNVALLGEGSQFRCNNLDWSEPMFEQILGYYSRASAAAPTSHADLMGKTICRPEGYATFMLEEHGLVEPNVTMVRPTDPATCFSGVANGDIDFVALAADTSEGVIAELGLGDEIRFDEDLSQVLTIHAVISKTNPHAEEYLAALDSGINAIKENGEWFSIIRRHLTAHRALTQ